MTPDRIAELRALCEAATPGPWFFDEYQNVTGKTGIVTGPGSIDGPENNCNFICEARTALPEAIDEIERLRAELSTVRLAGVQTGKAAPVDMLAVMDAAESESQRQTETALGKYFELEEEWVAGLRVEFADRTHQLWLSTWALIGACHAIGNMSNWYPPRWGRDVLRDLDPTR